MSRASAISVIESLVERGALQLWPEGSDLSGLRPSGPGVTNPTRIKFGIDPTESRLHLGHFVALRTLSKLSRAGLGIDLVLGTLTAQMGDPSGRDATRPLLSQGEVDVNAGKILKTVSEFMRAGMTPLDSLRGLRNFRIHKNHKLAPTLSGFMRAASKLTVNRLMARSSFEGRSVSAHEIMVPILQAWDSVRLKTEVELGGIDQMTNFSITRDLQGAYGQEPRQICLLVPILNGTDGAKMSKSRGNCIWLDDTPRDIFGKIMSIPDELNEPWFRLLTDRNMSSLSPYFLDQKLELADLVTSQICGDELMVGARDHFRDVIQGKHPPMMPPAFPSGPLIDFVSAMRTPESRTEIRRLNSEGAVHINGEPIFAFDHEVVPGDMVRAGKLFWAVAE